MAEEYIWELIDQIKITNELKTFDFIILQQKNKMKNRRNEENEYT